jgi:hypothetical protein
MKELNRYIRLEATKDDGTRSAYVGSWELLYEHIYDDRDILCENGFLTIVATDGIEIFQGVEDVLRFFKVDMSSTTASQMRELVTWANLDNGETWCEITMDNVRIRAVKVDEPTIDINRSMESFSECNKATFMFDGKPIIDVGTIGNTREGLIVHDNCCEDGFFYDKNGKHIDKYFPTLLSRYIEKTLMDKVRGIKKVWFIVNMETVADYAHEASTMTCKMSADSVEAIREATTLLGFDSTSFESTYISHGNDNDKTVEAVFTLGNICRDYFA